MNKSVERLKMSRQIYKFNEFVNSLKNIDSRLARYSLDSTDGTYLLGALEKGESNGIKPIMRGRGASHLME